MCSFFVFEQEWARSETMGAQSDRKALIRSLYYKACGFVLFFVVAAASFNGYYDKFRLLDIDEFGNLHSRLAFEPMLEGTASRPFVYRQLLPMTANWINRHVSTAVQTRLFTRYVHTGISIGRDPYDSPVLHDPHYFLRYVLVYVMVFLFAWAAVYAMFHLARAVGNPPAASALAAMTLVLLFPYFLINAGFYYDYPELFFFALVVWMALKVDWWWILPVAALATWNKESFLSFTPALYPLLRQKTTRVGAVLRTGSILVACAAVYEPLRLRFRHNAGGTVENHLREQFQAMLHPATLLTREWNYGLLGLQGLNPLTILLAMGTVWFGWHHLPRAIQRHALICLVINLPLFILFCAPGELRDLSMLYVPLLLLIAANLTQWSALPPTALPSSR